MYNYQVGFYNAQNRLNKGYAYKTTSFHNIEPEDVLKAALSQLPSVCQDISANIPAFTTGVVSKQICIVSCVSTSQIDVTKFTNEQLKNLAQSAESAQNPKKLNFENLY